MLAALLPPCRIRSRIFLTYIQPVCVDIGAFLVCRFLRIYRCWLSWPDARPSSLSRRTGWLSARLCEWGIASMVALGTEEQEVGDQVRPSGRRQISRLTTGHRDFGGCWMWPHICLPACTACLHCLPALPGYLFVYQGGDTKRPRPPLTTCRGRHL